LPKGLDKDEKKTEARLNELRRKEGVVDWLVILGVVVRYSSKFHEQIYLSGGSPRQAPLS